jgi:hypothetical protein
MVPSLPPLSEWENFYVITGSAGAALTGLQFVVIALRTEAIVEGGEGAVRAFATPTVLHLAGVLLIAAIQTIPHQNVASLSLCIGAAAVAGLVFSGRVVFHARRQRAYSPVLSDWIWHVALPFTAYASLAAAARMLWRWPSAALDLVGAASLLLLFVGIHNAWDSAVWIAAGRHQAPR